MHPTSAPILPPSTLHPAILLRNLVRASVLLALGLLLALATARPGQAWNLSCTSLCNAATAHQSYGTGSADSACHSACAYPAVHPCPRLWFAYFQCVDNGEPASICRGHYAAAKECAVCDHGLVDGTWNANELIFVNPKCKPNTDPTLPPGYVPAGTYDDPWCGFYDGLEAAVGRQQNEESSRVLVCKGTYREGHIGDAAWNVGTDAGNKAEVIVESVVRGNAVVSGAEDWSGAWAAQYTPFPETLYNQLLHSTDLTQPHWPHSAGVKLEQVPVAPNQVPQGLPSGPIYELSVDGDAQATSPIYAYQTLPVLHDRLVTFSVYVKAKTTDRMRIEFRRAENSLVDAEQGEGGAFYTFQIPQGQTCDPEEASSSAAGYGVEHVGNDWYRVHLSEAMSHDPTSPNGPTGLVMVRMHLVGPLQHGQSLLLYGPQLDHRPLERFETTPRTYQPTTSTIASTNITNWKLIYQNNPNFETWNHDWGLARRSEYWGNLTPLMRRSEMIYVDDQPLRQVLSKDDLEPGTFFVDDGIPYGGFNYAHREDWIPGQCSDTSPCPILIEPPLGVNPNTVPVEVAERARLLWITEPKNWTFRGLTFRHATGAYDSDEQGACPTTSEDCVYPLNTSAVSIFNSQNLTLLENRFDWNAAHGVSVGGVLGGSNIHLIRNAAVDNGIGGEFLGSAWNFTIDGEVLARNNWRGRQALVSGHITTGAKYAGNAFGTLSNIQAHDNFGNGIWFDHENQGLLLTDCMASFNRDAGIYFEANDAWFHDQHGLDPTTTVQKCAIEGNFTGVQGISSSRIRIDGNYIENNRSAVSLIGIPRVDTDPTDGIDPTKFLRDWELTNNIVIAHCSDQDWLRYGDEKPAAVYSDWWPVMDTLVSDGNDYFHPDGLAATGFWLKGLELTFDAWRDCDPGEDAWCSNPQDGSSTAWP